MERYSDFALDRLYNPCFLCDSDLWTDSLDYKAICELCDAKLADVGDSQTELGWFN